MSHALHSTIRKMDITELRKQKASEFGKEIDACVQKARQYLIDELDNILKVYPEKIELDAFTSMERVHQAESLKTLIHVIKEYHCAEDEFRKGFYESHACSVLFTFSELWNGFLRDVGTESKDNPLTEIQHELTQITQTMDKARFTKSHNEIMITIFLQQANRNKSISERAINWVKGQNMELRGAEIEENVFASCMHLDNIQELKKMRSIRGRAMKRKKTESESEPDTENEVKDNYQQTMKLLVKACVALGNVRDDQLKNKIESARGKHSWLAWALPVGKGLPL